jgi:adenylate kinase family enzyme
MLELG